MSPFKCWLVVLLVMTQVICALGLTKAQVKAIVPDITNLIRDSFVNTAKFEHPILGTLVRLAFHDCAGRDGCDGCLNTTLAANGGLGDVVEFLEDIYQAKALQSVLSRADYWALAGVVAVNMSIPRGPRKPAVPAALDPLNFKWGRKDCAASPMALTDVAANFPGALLGSAGVQQYFATMFNFTAKQTVAIMGAHNLGKAHNEYSGFNDSWTVNGTELGSEYYSNMVKPSLNWVQGQVPNGNYKWQPSAGTAPQPPIRGKVATAPKLPAIMMLDADMALYKNLNPNTVGKVQCSFSGCPLAQNTNGLVNQFAGDAGAFLNAFADAFTKMQAVCGRPTIGTITKCSLKQVQ